MKMETVNLNYFLENNLLEREIVLYGFKSFNDCYNGQNAKKHVIKADYKPSTHKVLGRYQTGGLMIEGSPKLTEEVLAKIAALQKQYHSLVHKNAMIGSW